LINKKIRIDKGQAQTKLIIIITRKCTSLVKDDGQGDFKQGNLQKQKTYRKKM
jgi:hypothetical protein